MSDTNPAFGRGYAKLEFAVLVLCAALILARHFLLIPLSFDMIVQERMAYAAVVFSCGILVLLYRLFTGHWHRGRSRWLSLYESFLLDLTFLGIIASFAEDLPVPYDSIAIAAVFLGLAVLRIYRWPQSLPAQQPAAVSQPAADHPPEIWRRRSQQHESSPQQ